MMDERDLLKVRLALAEARVASMNRHSEFMAEFGDIAIAMSDFWHSKAPEGTELPAELVERINDFRERGA